MSTLFKLLMLSFLVILTGCAHDPKKDNPPYKSINDEAHIQKRSLETPSDLKQVEDIPQFPETESLMAPGHLFSLNHPSDEKLRGQFRAAFDGLLRLPYGVVINVTGKQFPELKKEVLDSYNKFFQRGASDVSFILIGQQYWVEVRGFVKKSGQYLVDRKESIDKVIDKAGGLNGSLKTDFFSVSIKQKDMSYAVSLNQYYDNNAVGTTFTWTGGDTVFINLMNHETDVPTVSVLGGVLVPGKTLYQKNATLYYYLQKSGGIIPNLGYEECYVIRKTNNVVTRINFDITDMNTVPIIKAGDIIMMTADKRTMWDKIWERTTQMATLVSSMAILVLAL